MVKTRSIGRSMKGWLASDRSHEGDPDAGPTAMPMEMSILSFTS